MKIFIIIALIIAGLIYFHAQSKNQGFGDSLNDAIEKIKEIIPENQTEIQDVIPEQIPDTEGQNLTLIGKIPVTITTYATEDCTNDEQCDKSLISCGGNCKCIQGNCFKQS